MYHTAEALELEKDSTLPHGSTRPGFLVVFGGFESTAGGGYVETVCTPEALCVAAALC